ncbi:SIMPL domain-containing protein [Lederbergia panacisoli]|uniref:SIMPL domain-containing protein n=1 Tax=Lederbergia panacisoli TaxID=1255251 RepID=UPI00214B3DEF|nr:SIMPL domain-containing protein [Lederbergia panacisoli]MCR2821684.1 SIMPL domain-containing protein [Lederbergia panacisoli]
MHYQTYQVSDRSHESKKDIIQVIGEGKVSVQPDHAKVTLGASTEDKALQVAQEENAVIITEIKKALNQIGITDKQIQTTDYSIYPQYDFANGKQEFRGYKVDHLLQISIHHIESTGLVVDTAVKHGANTISGVKFEVSNYNQYYKEALSMAVINAYEKAETIASTLKVRLVKTPILVTENEKLPGGPIPLEAAAFVKSAATTPIQPGILDIKSTITATFEYQ